MSVVHFMAFPNTISGEGPVLETVTKIAEDPFFGAVEIGWIKDPQVRKTVKHIVDIAHIQVGHAAQSAVLLGKLNPNSLDEAERQHAVNQLCCSVDEAAEMGCKRVAFLSGKDPGDADRPKAFAALLQTVKQVSAYGREKGIALTLETFDRSIDKKSLIGPSPYAAEFAQAVREDFPEFGLLYDLSHMPLLFETANQAIGTLKDYLVHIHIGNGVVDPALQGYGDLHPRFGFPGGCNDVDELTGFIRALLQYSYLDEKKAEKPWVGFEVKPLLPEETPALVLANAKRVWQEAWTKA